jgi:hypothetical protein
LTEDLSRLPFGSLTLGLDKSSVNRFIANQVGYSRKTTFYSIVK